MLLPIKTWSWTQIAGVVMLHVVKNYGKSSASGYGTFAWSWVTSLLPNRCAQPSLLLPSHLRKQRPLPHGDFARQKWLCPGKLVASRGETSLFSPMARYVVLLSSHW